MTRARLESRLIPAVKFETRAYLGDYIRFSNPERLL